MIAKWNKLCEEMATEIEKIDTLHDPLCFKWNEVVAMGNNIQATLTKVEALADKWVNSQPSPYADAFSDLPPDIRSTRKCGRDLKAILQSIVSKEVRTEKE